MTTETGTFTPTDEDVERARNGLWTLRGDREPVRAVLETIGPIIERERQAAYDEGWERGYDAGVDHQANMQDD